MKIRIKSLVTGDHNIMELPVEAAELLRWKRGGDVGVVFPNLTVGQRSFLVTGQIPKGESK